MSIIIQAIIEAQNLEEADWMGSAITAICDVAGEKATLVSMMAEDDVMNLPHPGQLSYFNTEGQPVTIAAPPAVASAVAPPPGGAIQDDPNDPSLG